MEPSWKLTARTIVLSIILGGAAGVLTTALTTNYLSRYAVELGELTEPLRLSDERPRAFPQSYEEAIAEVMEKVTPGVVEFYRADAESGAVAVADAIARGVVLTSDGWLLSVSESPQLLTQARVLVDGEMHPVSQVVVDDVTGVLFVKIDADNLPVLAFGEARDTLPGEQVFAIPHRDGLLSASVTGFDWGTEVLWSSDEPNRTVALSLVAEGLLGVPVANAGGELLGVMVAEDSALVLPIESILPAFTTLIRGGEIVHPSLGLQTIDLTRSLGLSDEATRGYHSGALIPNAFGAIVRGSAAAEAGLLAGDIILSVNGQPVNGKVTLDEHVRAALPEQTLTFSVDRDGELMEIPVVLGVL